MTDIAKLEKELDSFDINIRTRALEGLIEAAGKGEIELPPPGKDVNLHGHTFFSYNGYGYSPTRFAWEARKAGLGMAGTVDFDVLDAMAEIYTAGDMLGLPTSAGLETRVYVKEYADKELSSPGEPGITYFMGIGFVRPPQTEAGRATLASMQERAHQRNRGMLARINPYLLDIQLDYEADVLPLTPSGNATERHMLEALEKKSHEHFGSDQSTEAGFWSDKLDISKDSAIAHLQNSNMLRDLMRSKLMKRGGVGYVSPDSSTFPAIEEVIEMIISAGAIPTITWLDGTSDGENDAAAMVDCLVGKGCHAINIIPDRNWAITDPVEKEEKVNNLYAIVEVCRQRHIPIIVGTEMNKYGLKFVDTFDAPELEQVLADFHAGADFLYGHTLMARACNHGSMSDWAGDAFGDRAARVAFYTQLGEKAGSPQESLEKLGKLADTHTPQDALDTLL